MPMFLVLACWLRKQTLVVRSLMSDAAFLISCFYLFLRAFVLTFTVEPVLAWHGIAWHCILLG
jgi:hypothetical protein